LAIGKWGEIRNEGEGDVGWVISKKNDPERRAANANLMMKLAHKCHNLKVRQDVYEGYNNNNDDDDDDEANLFFSTASLAAACGLCTRFLFRYQDMH